jgi:uncharacterized membrane protein
VPVNFAALLWDKTSNMQTSVKMRGREGTAAMERVSPAAARTRFQSVDILRGLVMALMALDHTRDFFSDTGFNPRDVTEAGVFLTRWITHFCAPTFVLLAGLSAYLYGRDRSVGETSRFLFTRGLWLIAIEFTLVRLGWAFEFVSHPTAGVIWVIGASMVVLAGLIHLPRWAIAVFALVTIAGHNLFDGMATGGVGLLAALWHVLHEPGDIALGGDVSVYILYPLIPWVGVMAAGYALGPAMEMQPAARRRILFGLGAAITFGFVLLRLANVYGDPTPWTVQATSLTTVLSFLNCEKYPPSLLFLMMTLGPALMLLAALEDVQGVTVDWLAVFGRVPFFFYVVHIYLIHALMVATRLATGSEPTLGLLGIYGVWLVVLVLLYPACRWFAGLKQRRREWWWSYL